MRRYGMMRYGMMRYGMGTAVKSLAVLAGAGVGLFGALSAFARANPHDIGALKRRLDEVEGRLACAATREDISGSADDTLERLEKLIEARFENQSRPIEALRVMIGQTDQLLQRVLDGLESGENESGGGDI